MKNNDVLKPAVILVLIGVAIGAIFLFIEIFFRQNFELFIGVGAIVLVLIGVALGKTSNKHN